MVILHCWITALFKIFIKDLTKYKTPCKKGLCTSSPWICNQYYGFTLWWRRLIFHSHTQNHMQIFWKSKSGALKKRNTLLHEHMCCGGIWPKWENRGHFPGELTWELIYLQDKIQNGRKHCALRWKSVCRSSVAEGDYFEELKADQWGRSTEWERV